MWGHPLTPPLERKPLPKESHSKLSSPRSERHEKFDRTVFLSFSSFRVTISLVSANHPFICEMNFGAYFSG